MGFPGVKFLIRVSYPFMPHVRQLVQILFIIMVVDLVLNPFGLLCSE
jgi:hypothetical protein